MLFASISNVNKNQTLNGKAKQLVAEAFKLISEYVQEKFKLQPSSEPAIHYVLADIYYLRGKMNKHDLDYTLAVKCYTSLEEPCVLG